MSKLEDSLKKLKKNLESSDAKKRRTTNNDTSGTAKKAQKAKKKSSSEGYKRRETNEPTKHRINGGGSNTASSDGYKRRITNKTALPKGSFADRFKKDTADFKKHRITSETRDQRDSRIRQEYGKRPEVKKSKVLSEEKRIERARNITPGGGYTPDVYKGLDENRDTVDALVNRAFEGTAAAITGAYDAGVTFGNATINKYAGRIGRITGKDPRDFEINGKKIWEYQKDVQESSEDAWKTISGYDQKAIEKLESEGKIESYLGEISSAIGFMLPSLAAGAGAGSIAGNAVLGVTAAGAETNSIYYQLRDKRLEDGAMTKKDFTDIVNRAGLTGAAVGTGEILSERLTGGLPIFGKGIVDTFAGRTARGMLSKESREAIDAFNKTMRGKIITTAMKRGFGAVGEGAEEVIMEAAQPLMERIIAGVDSDYATIEDLKKSFGMGAVISLLFGFSPDTIQYGMAVAQKVEENKFEKGVKDYVKVGLASAVKNGEMTREEAENHYQRLVDNLSGKGDIEGSDVVRRTDTESKVTSEDSKVYETKQEAVDSLNSDLKSKSIGDTVSAVYTDENGTHTVTGKVSELQGGKALVGVREGITTEADTRRYAAKLEQVKSAKNITERTGAQLNVRPELVKEMSELSEALGRPVVFEDVAGKQTNRGTMKIERGWFDKDGIHVNVRSNATAGYVVAHEMTHAMEGTKGYKTFRNFIYDYYKSSTGAEEARLLGLYGKLVKPEDVSTEVIANFVETKLFSDPTTIAEFVKANPTLSDRFVMGLNKVIQRTAGTKEQRFLSKARSLWTEGIEESRKNTPGDVLESTATERERFFNGEGREPRQLAYGEESDYFRNIEEIRKEYSEKSIAYTKARNEYFDKVKSDEYMSLLSKLDDPDADIDQTISEIAVFEKENNVGKLKRAMDEAYEAYRKANRDLDSAERNFRKKSIIEYRKQYNADFNERMARRAEKHFGITNNMRLAGYLDYNGKFIKFSHDYRQRDLDHREITEILDFPFEPEYSDGLIEFMNMGNIRLSSGGIDISVKPNQMQKKSLADFINMVVEDDEEFSIDFSDENGDNIDSIYYDYAVAPKKVLQDIDSFFDTGEKPYASEYSKFRYAYGEETLDQEYLTLAEDPEKNKARLREMVYEAAKRAGYPIRAYHGTKRADRVGNVFRPDRATSGPMAFFTDNYEIAENYSNDKSDTSIAYDSDYGSYETQFRAISNKHNHDMPLYEAWKYIPFSERNKIKQKAGQLRYDWGNDDYDSFILDEDNISGLGDFVYILKNNRGNVIRALTEEWLDNAELLNEEDRFFDVLELTGITDALKKIGFDIEYKNPNYEEKKVYDTYLGITKPFDAESVDEDFVRGFERWYKEQDRDIYEKETAGVDFWDKNNVSADEFAERLRDDIKNGTTHSWTSIPDSATDYLKSLGYDGIKDKGGKHHDTIHTVWIPFYSNQVKSADPVVYDDNGNIIPLSERFNPDNDDIRYAYGEEKVSKQMKTVVKEFGSELKEVSYSRSRADNAEMKNRVNGMLNEILRTGTYSNKTVSDVIDFIYDTGYRKMENEREYELWGKGTKIVIPEDLRGEMETFGGLGAVNKKLYGHGLTFTYQNTSGAMRLDEAYREFREMNPVLGEDDVEDIVDPSTMVENIVDAYTAKTAKVPLYVLDESEEEELGEDVYRKDIEEKVYNLADAVARQAAYENGKAAEKRGEKRGEEKGIAKGVKREQKAQSKRDMATMRAFDDLLTKITKEQRKADEATLREYDKLLKQVQKDAEKLTEAEKKKLNKKINAMRDDFDKELQRQIKAFQRERKKANESELKTFDRIMRSERSKQNAAEKQNTELKGENKQLKSDVAELQKERLDTLKEYDRMLKTHMAEEERKRTQKMDEADRKEAIARRKRMQKIARELRNAKTEAERKENAGTAKEKMRYSGKAKRVAESLRTDIVTYLAESGAFGKAENGLVLLDENGAEIAVKTNDKWKLSKYKNISTPSLGTALVAEQYGFDVDQFYTIYSKIVNMKGKQVPDPKNPGKKKIIFTKQQKVTDYINSLKLTAEQKRFLYLDVAKYAKSKMPTFLNGGKLVEAKGNKNGRLFKAIDQLAVNMYAGYYSRNSSYEESVANKIKLQDIADIADIVYSKDSEEKTKFEMYLTEAIINHAEDMDIVRLKEEVNLLTETPKEKDNLRTRVLNTWRRAKRDFLAEGEAYERMAKQCHDPRIAAAYYSARNFQTIADNMMTGDQRNIVGGEKMGKSLKSIFDPILKADEKAGNDNKMALLTKFVNARHDIDRAAADKGYTGRTIEENIAIVEKVKKENPDIVAVADEIVEYSRNLLMMCVDSGRISKETYDYFIAKYPNYVPTFRVQEGTVDRNGKIVSRDIKVIREAKGGNEDVLPLYDQLARRTKEIVKSCKNNQLATYLAMSFRKHEADDFISNVVEAEEKKNRDAESESVHEIGTVENMGKAWNEAGRENNIPVFIDGVKYNIVCTDENLLYGWDRINYYADENTASAALRKFNNVRRGILTQYNPTFWLTNGIRDTFDMYLYNQHAHRLPKFHTEAFAIIFGGKLSKGRMFKNGEEMWQEYLSRGAAEASIFEYANIRKGKQTKTSKAKKIAGMPLEAFDTLNFMVEQTPRFAVYLETVDRLTKEQKKGKNDYTEDEIKTIAAYQAADATLNFGRSGTVAKWANSHGAVFLNASIQGMDRFFRMLSPFAETGKNFKRWVNTAKEADRAGVLFDRAEEGSEEETVAGAEYERLWNEASEAQYDFLTSTANLGTLCMKLSWIGVMPVVIATAIYTLDDDFWKNLREYFYGENADKVKREYMEMSDYNKTNYIMLNVAGKWYRIPAGHVMTFLRGGWIYGMEAKHGEINPIDALAEEASLFWDKVGMNNPLTNNVFTPLLDTWVNKDHWGNDIVSSWEEKKDGFHYLEADEDTTLAAQKIANFMHYVTGTVWGKEDSILDLSPKKIDYIIEQYAGSYYDLIMPFFSGKTMTDNALSMMTELAKKFYVDPVDSNRLAGDYYDTKDLYESIADKYGNDTPYAVAVKAFDEYDKELKGLRDEMKAISADTSLSRKERLKKIKAIKEKMNKLYRKGISDAQDCLEYGKANYTGVDDNSDIFEDAMGELRGSEYLYETLPDSAKGKYETCASTTDIDKGTFYDAYKQIGSLSSDRDANGKEIEGQGKQDKVIKYLDNLDIPSDQKDALWTNVCGYSDKNKPTFQSGSKGGVSLGNVVSPIQGKGTVSSHYGYRKAPTAGASSYHQAVDIAIPVGTPVGAAMAGTVTSISDKSTGYGKSVEVTTQDANGNIIVTKYSHMSEFGVEVGDHLEQGQQLGKSGNTGASTGPHLDFKVGLNNKWVDPEEYFDFSQAGIIDGKGYSTKSTPGGSSVNYGSSGGGKKGGGRKGGGRKSSGGGSIGSATASANRYTSTTSSIPTGSSSSGSSGSSSGSSSKYRQTASSFNTATLPRANVTGRSTQSATYGQKGVMLPRANQTSTSIAYNKTGGVSRTGRTGRSGGSMWNDSILG